MNRPYNLIEMVRDYDATIKEIVGALNSTPLS